MPMDSTTAAILAAIITGGLSLVGVILSNRAASSRMQAQLEKQQAVTDAKLEELTREVRAHNNFAQRVPVLEEKVKVANHRIEDLEKQTERLDALHTPGRVTCRPFAGNLLRDRCKFCKGCNTF